MGCERVDYSSDEEYQQALQTEQQQQECEDHENEYYARMNEFEDWIKHKHNGCWYSAAKGLGFPLDQNALFHHWLNPPKKETSEIIIDKDDLPF
jgi:hypothetical protein